jgi:hypothetical protein
MPSYFFVKSKVSRRNRAGVWRAHGRLETKPLRVARVLGGVGVADEQF